MAQDTLLGFPAHTFPYRRGEFTTLSTVSADAGFILRLLFTVDRKNCVYRTLERKSFSHRTKLLQKSADKLKNAIFAWKIDHSFTNC